MAALERMSSGKMRDAFRTWAHYIFHVLAPPHLDIDGMLADGNLRAEHRQLKGDAIEATIDTEATTGVASMLHERQLQSKIAPWHPACKLRLPGLPSCGVKQLPDGKYRIMDFARFNSFKKYQGGPTDYCSWLIHGAYARVMFGAYPCGQARIKADKITSRSSSAAQLLVDGVDTFVCLMESSELERRAAEHPKGWTYDVEVDTTCADIPERAHHRRQLCQGCHDVCCKARREGREVGYGKVQQEALERAQESRTYDYEKAKAFYDNFAERLQHVRVPVPKMGPSTTWRSSSCAKTSSAAFRRASACTCLATMATGASESSRLCSSLGCTAWRLRMR